MNSENPYIPESDPQSENPEVTIFEPVKSTPQLEELDQLKQQPEIVSEQVEEPIAEVTAEEQATVDLVRELEAFTEEFATPNLSGSADAKTVKEIAEDNLDNLSDQVNNESVKKPESQEPELFVDNWLDESIVEPAADSATLKSKDEIEQLAQQKAQLEREIIALKTQKEELLTHQLREAQENMARMIEEGTKELRERKTALRIEIEKLERRQERLNQEMRSNFAGSSKELAIRVQGFKEYLVGSLQDLATAADKLELVRSGDAVPRNRDRSRNTEEPRRETRDLRGDRDSRNRRNRDLGTSESPRGANTNRSSQGQFSEPTFADQSRRIRQLLDKYCNSPDYYGAPWQLRRTFDQTQAKKVQDWFFTQGGRGAVDSTGSRLQNILLASATISILHDLYRDRTQVLILTDTPENLGEWRKGIEDCLGISRRDFGTNRGVVLFDSPEILVQRAERLLADKLLPIIIIDETEEQLNLSVLKFPIWLAFASNNRTKSSTNYLY